MKLSQLAMAATVAASMFLTSCGKKDTADSLSDEVVDQMNALADAMASVKDKESAEAAAKEIEKVGDAMVDIAERFEALGDPSEEDKKLVSEKLDAAEKAMEEKMKSSGEAMMKDPAVAKIIMEAMNKVGERMKEVDKTMDKYKLDK